MRISKGFKGSVALLATLVALSLTSCSAISSLLGGDTGTTTPDIEIAGTWLDSAYGTNMLTISNSSYVVDDQSSYDWDYTCEIVKYSNDGFNAGETGTGNCGYAVVKFTVHPNSTSSVGKYTVLRWQNLTTSGSVTVSTSEGYGTYFDTAAAAEAGATAAAGYFSYYSASTKQ